ncbi:hypothetical protein C2U53_28035 [Citrobacter sp. CFNIH10]|nr:hypothetical protein C2U53_28035 [Citrobacter sp. CFNIH10]
MFYLGTALFYKTDKGITGRRAHNPIHPGGCSRRCSCLFCGETNWRWQSPVALSASGWGIY